MMLAARIPGWPRALQPLAESCCSAGRAAFVTTHLGTGMPSPASLNDIMKVDEMRGKTAGEVEEIWMQCFNFSMCDAAQFHLDDNKQRAGAVLPGPLWRSFETRARVAPNFVLPIGKGQGKSLTMLLQCQLPYALFTSLEDFKQLGAGAPPNMTVTHYPDLLGSHNIVLARADVVSPHVVSAPEARTLMALMHAFYSDPQSFLRVNEFNHEPHKFRYEDLLRELGHTTDGAT